MYPGVAYLTTVPTAQESEAEGLELICNYPGQYSENTSMKERREGRKEERKKKERKRKRVGLCIFLR